MKAGGGADVLTLDSELSKDVDQVTKDAKVSRGKVLLESIRIGILPLYNGLMREQVIHIPLRLAKSAAVFFRGFRFLF